MLFPSSYHTAIVQTGAAMFSIAAPIAGHSIAPIIDAPARPAIDYKMWSAVNDNTSQLSVRGKGSPKPSETSSLSRFDDAHNEAIFTALMASSTEVSGPIYVD